MKTYCFDFDGVICHLEDDVPYPERKPNYKIIREMHAIMERGDRIIIYTGRHINHLDDTLQWLNNYTVPYTHIQFGKPVADLYIDDKGINVEDFRCQENY